MTLLDTNLVSAFLHPDAAVRSAEQHSFVQTLMRGDGFSIAYVTQFELRRGAEELVRRGQGRRKLVVFAATAAFHGRTFATSEGRLAENLRKIGFPVDIQIVPTPLARGAPSDSS